MRIRERFNPRAPCGARRERYEGQEVLTMISTHAPLAGRDKYDANGRVVLEKFQPTRPLRGATAKEYKSLCTFLR